MGWLVSRQEVTSEPEAARRKVLALLANIEDVPDPEEMLLNVLVDAVMLVEAYRGARHEIVRLPELQNSVDALLRDLTVSERINQWSREPEAEEAVAAR
ncbi:MAG: hypothetical protein ACK4SZ_04990 [Allosphingosinicella sp.]|uniref:hypothetical protein n=1 Tax=Allosphingosinicella sp. TaxID=2823234 RepID=UPI003937D47F